VSAASSPKRRAPRVPRVKVQALETALCTLLEHGWLIEAALTDHVGQPSDLTHVCGALRHIIDDGFRSSETRGSS
jgi:hypothetical protein